MENKDFILEKRLRALDPELHRNFVDAAFALQNLLSKYKQYFPEYTDHSELHSLDVINFCNQLIGKERAERLNADEIYVLLMGCYLHDVGMGLTEKDYKEFMSMLDMGDYFATHDPEDIAQIIRDYHQEFSGLFIQKYAPLFDFPSDAHMFATIQIVRGHRKTDLFDETEYPEVLKLENGNTICLPYLAAIMCLADEIDVADDRNLKALFDVSKIKDKKQIVEFKKHAAVRRIEVTKDAFTLDVETSEIEVRRGILQLVKKMQKTLDYCVSLVEKRTPYKITQRKVIMNVRIDHEVIDLFEQISRIPRESGNEKAVSDWIKEWAQARGLNVEQDEIWNLIIKKPASKGYENHAPVMMQAHIDMVCEKNKDSQHDFAKDPIVLKTDGEWLISESGTTLGADNGVGVAAALAVLDDDTLEHPPLEVVFTVQEETTFAGAETVDVSGCEAMQLINLGHADERELIVGSCGGTGVTFTMPLERETKAPEGYSAFHLAISGLKGGHSGEDIHRGRGNAISLLLRVLESPGIRTISISGGTNRLAIPREAEAVVIVEDEAALQRIVETAKAVFRKEYSVAAPDLDIVMTKAEAEAPLTVASFQKISQVIRLYPNGIVQMNGGFDGLVESSDNIGIISTKGDMLTLTSEVRGAYQSTVDDIVKTIETLADLVGAETSYFSAYVPWEFAADSKLRAIATDTYREMFGGEMKQLALHAGLECGFFAEKKPGIDIISIGPDCQYFHSPEERVRIESIVHFYDILKVILRKL